MANYAHGKGNYMLFFFIKTLMNVDQIYSYLGLIAIIETLPMVTKINTFNELFVAHFIKIIKYHVFRG